MRRRISSSGERRRNGGGGSNDDSHKRAPVKLDKASVRKINTRCPFATLDVTDKEGKFVYNITNRAIGSGGLILHGPKAQSLDERLAWAHENPTAKEKVTFLPEDAAVVIHPGEQRYFVRNIGRTRLFLDLSLSELRDRLVLRKDMQIIFTDGEKESVVTVTLSSAAVSYLPSSTWREPVTLSSSLSRAGDPGLLSDISDFASIFPRSGSNDSSTLPPPLSATQSTIEASQSGSQPPSDHASSTTTDASTKVKFKDIVQVVELSDKATVTEQLIKDEVRNDHVQSTVVENTDNTAFHIELGFDGKSFALEHYSARAKSVFVFGASEAHHSDNPAIRLPFPVDSPEDPLAVFLLGQALSQLVLPRVATTNGRKVRALLAIPHDSCFPLITGDVLVVRGHCNKTQETRMKLTIPKLSRSAPSERSVALEEGGALNPDHFMSGIAIEASHQKRNSTTPPFCSSISFPEEFFRPVGPGAPPNMILIGRSEEKCNVSVPDPHLSRLHAVVTRQGTHHYTLAPAETRKSVYLLCGKTDSHNRPPVALRTGDTLFIGRSEFKVVFQQRGDRKVSVASARAELETKINMAGSQFHIAPRKIKGQDLGVEDLKAAGTEQPTGAPRPEDDFPDPLDQMQSSFKTLKVNASEKVEKPQDLTLEASDIPVFRDVSSLLTYFDLSSALHGPLMILMSVRGPKAKQFFLCNPVETTIGSSLDAHICISNDRRMSPIHCRIQFDSSLERWCVSDLQSKHGTFLKVDEPTLLCSGDLFVMGMSVFRVLGRQYDPGAAASKSMCHQQ